MFRSLIARIAPQQEQEQPAMIVGKAWSDWDAPVVHATPMTWAPSTACDPNAAWGE